MSGRLLALARSAFCLTATKSPVLSHKNKYKQQSITTHKPSHKITKNKCDGIANLTVNTFTVNPETEMALGKYITAIQRKTKNHLMGDMELEVREWMFSGN